MIKLAVWSEWTVEEYEEDNPAKDSDNQKRIAKAEYHVEKKQQRAIAKRDSSNRKIFVPLIATEEMEWATPPPL